MNAWERCVTAALVGTEGHPPPDGEAAGALGELLGQLGDGEPERALLQALAVTGSWQRAGRRPGRGNAVAVPAPCEPEERSRLSPRAAVQLALLLSGAHREVLPEWLAGAARAGRLAPPRLLPELLETGRRQPTLREAILPLLGRRGRWLAALNPEWAWAAGDAEDVQALWETGERDARELLLRRLRREEPESARVLLTSTWGSETPADRARFLACLGEGLGMADERCLEAALDDRRKEVRKVAADLLARLPQSGLCRRMEERVRPLVRVGRAGTLHVDLPAACDPGAARDGVEAKPPLGQTVGERSWWLQQLIGSAPTFAWATALGRSPRELVRLSVGHESGAVLRAGWLQAAIRQGDREWITALVEESGSAEAVPPVLVFALPPEQRDAYVLRLLQTDRRPLGNDHPALPLLGNCRPWSAALTRAVLESIHRRIQSAPRPEVDWPLRAALRDLALSVPPELADEAAAGWPRHSPAWESWDPAVDEFLQLVRFRQEMHEELKP